MSDQDLHNFIASVVLIRVVRSEQGWGGGEWPGMSGAHVLSRLSSLIVTTFSTPPHPHIFYDNRPLKLPKNVLINQFPKQTDIELAFAIKKITDSDCFYPSSV